jgi:hypothetical protein
VRGQWASGAVFWHLLLFSVDLPSLFIFFNSLYTSRSLDREPDRVHTIGVFAQPGCVETVCCVGVRTKSWPPLNDDACPGSRRRRGPRATRWNHDNRKRNVRSKLSQAVDGTANLSFA